MEKNSKSKQFDKNIQNQKSKLKKTSQAKHGTFVQTQSPSYMKSFRQTQSPQNRELFCQTSSLQYKENMKKSR